MTEAPAGASALFSPIPGSAPEGELTAAQAFARRSELVNDAEFKTKLDRGDPAARGEIEKISRGLAGDLLLGSNINPAQFGPKAAEQHAAAGALAREKMIDGLRMTAAIDEGVADMIRNSTPVSKNERRMAQQEMSRLKADPDFVKAYLAGNRDARTRMTLCNIILTQPTKD
jgi:hypothetical protein